MYISVKKNSGTVSDDVNVATRMTNMERHTNKSLENKCGNTGLIFFLEKGARSHKTRLVNTQILRYMRKGKSALSLFVLHLPL